MNTTTTTEQLHTTPSWELALASFGCAAVLCFILLSRRQASEFWVTKELATLGTPRTTPRHGKAVICGGGIAGVMAARSCLMHFEEVVLVDPEFSRTLTGTPKSRVMQYNSIHGYLILFAEGLRRLWPSFNQKSEEAREAKTNGDYGLYVDGTYIKTPIVNQPSSFNMRRGTLEPLLHNLLVDTDLDEETKKRLTVIDGTVRGMKCSPGTERVTRVEGKNIDGTEFEVDDIGLFIDCSGRAQTGMKWLQEAGFAPPTRVTYSPHLRYATVTFNVSDELYAELPLPDKHKSGGISYIPNAEVDHRALTFGQMDNGTIQICGNSWGAGHPLPKQPEEVFSTFTSIKYSTPFPAWYVETIRLLTENGDPSVVNAQMASCSHVEYHRAERLPSNFIALGDAIMVLNPVYGQGCTKSMIGIMLLDRMLRENTSGKIPTGFSEEFFKEMAGRMNILWDSVKASDYGFSTTEPTKGESLQHGSGIRAFGKIIMQAAELDEQVALVLWKTRHLLAAESEFMKPAIVARMLWAHARRAFGGFSTKAG